MLRPTYARSYLAVAYRYLSGIGLNVEEQKAVQALWQERLNREWNPGDQDGIQHWLTARNAVPGVGAPPEINDYRELATKGDYFLNYLNCPTDAFQTAVSTLEKRVAEFGAKSTEVRKWIAAQDQVFANCSSGHRIPPVVPADTAALLRADRTYQIAAANFYAGNYDAAKQTFAEIARDPSSPWRQLAPYLLARTLFREAILRPQVDTTLLAQAGSQAETVLHDTNLSDVHAAAQRLLNRVHWRLQPQTQLHDLAVVVVQKNAGALLKQSLWDYTLLLDTLLGGQDAYTLEEKRQQMSQNFAAQDDIRSKDDLTDWLLIFQGESNATVDHAVKKWSETSSLPWLVASLAKIPASHPQAAALLAAAEKIPSTSPAYPTVVFHRVRLLVEAGKKDQAREQLAALLAPGGQMLPRSSRNLFLALRMPLSRNLDEWFTYAQRVPIGIFYDENGLELPEDEGSNDELKPLADGRPFFDADATQILNHDLPLSLLTEAVNMQALPEHLRREVALATWIRAVVLDDTESSKKLVPTVASLVPALHQDLDSYQTADNNDARKFAAVLLMLRFPGTRPYIGAGIGRLTPLGAIDDYRDNWWCSLKDPRALGFANFLQLNEIATNPGGDATPNGTTTSGTSHSVPDFLNQAQQKNAEEEWQHLANLGAAPSYLSQQVLDWAKKNPADSRVPEALHLAVRSTRYGCTDTATTSYSKQAFQFLHKQYPNSPWTKKTPYWY